MTEETTATLRQQYLQNLLAARRKEAHDLIMDAYRRGLPIPSIYADILHEALYEVGRLWEANRISVTEEHLSTAITQFVMSSLYPHLEMSPHVRGRMVLTGVQGELHQVGANMVADLLEADGWEVLFLGADVPPERVLQAVQEHEAGLLGISVTMLANLPQAAALVALIRSQQGERTPRILLGGGAFAALEQVPPELEGCLLARTLPEALELTRRIS